MIRDSQIPLDPKGATEMADASEDFSHVRDGDGGEAQWEPIRHRVTRG